MTSYTSDFAGQLKACKIITADGISLGFPVSEVILGGSQDLIQHKKPNVDGARVEGTGRNPLTIKVKAPFLNGLTPIAGEEWSPDELFPFRFLEIYNVLLSNDTVQFVHPIFGTFNVKPVSFTTATIPNMRNGQELDFELLQVNISNGDSLTIENVFGSGLSSAQDLDGQLNPPPPGIPVFTFRFADLFTAIKAILSQTALFLQSGPAMINRGLYQLQQIEDSVAFVEQSAKSSDSLQYSLIRQNVSRVRSSLFAIRDTGANRVSKLRVYVTPAPMTLSAIVIATGDSMDDLIKYNPSIINKLLVPMGTVIYYMAPRK